MDHAQQTEQPESNLVTKQKDDKLPHDASVFVGSLPSNIDQGDLSRMLTEHLSEHTQIRNIKVVRDSKGGVCAFVQCEDAQSARDLIDTLQDRPPKPFMGRILRYEPARAFRTLLISYRKPTRLFHAEPMSHHLAPVGEEVELQLPSAMRIWKQRNSRFHSILYNAEAIQAHDGARHVELSPTELENVFFMDPINYDEDALKSLATFFGPLESFDLVNAKNNSQETPHESSEYPSPHDAPRSVGMDARCWEVKWQHRDDCVGALMTLRRIPHVTATWAHQPSVLPSLHSHLYPRTMGVPPYAIHVQPRTADTHSFMPPNVFHPQFAQPFQQPSHARGQHQRGLSHPYFGRALVERMPHSMNREAHGIDRGHTVKAFHQIDAGPKVGDQNRHIAEPSSPDSDGQEVFMPQTPALDSSSITPVTPGSQFPVTPTTSGASHDSFGLRDEALLWKPGHNREVDPTTLFVGGLEMSGPGAWDEERVRSFFSRFGGLESVKVVRPVHAAAAFAFVKFDNPESPARACRDEHNRIYNGRAMRVQLRDINPPRNNFKFSRTRSRFPHHQYTAHRHFNDPASLHVQGKDPRSFLPGPLDGHDPDMDSSITMTSLAHALPAIDDTTRPEASDATSCAPSVPDVTTNEGTDPPRYREWYDELQTPAATPEPSSLGSSASTTGLPCAAPSYQYRPTGGYYPPGPWMPPYLTANPYPVHFFPGYTTYVPPHAQLQPPPQGSASSSDSSNSTSVGHPIWPAMSGYGSFIPYPVLPAQMGIPSQSPIAAQPPVVPAGFIQNEQGALVAVYQPEAINQYMAVGPNASSTPTMCGEGTQRLPPQTPPPARPYDQCSGVPATPPSQSVRRGAHVREQHHAYGSAPQRPAMPFRHSEGNFMNAPGHGNYRRPQNRGPQRNFHSGGGAYPDNSPRGFNGRGRGYLQNVPPIASRVGYDWS